MNAFAPWLLLILTITIISALIFYPSWRNKLLLKGEFPEDWLVILHKDLPFLKNLSEQEQTQLQNLIRLFIGQKQFHGCDGLQITDEIKVIIAAEACLLLLNRNAGIYPRLKHILVYPSAFVAKRDRYNEDGTVSNIHQGLLGESWHAGKVILSWDDVESGAANFSDGRNVVLHEFSHQLDSESGSTNGAPVLRRNSYATWATVLGKEYSELQDDLDKRHKSVMDYYGATNPAEFFAVATETFFEKPQQLKKNHPELFEEFLKYYAVDPTSWQ